MRIGYLMLPLHRSVTALGHVRSAAEYLDASRQVLGVLTLDVIDIHESGDQSLPIDNPGGKSGLMDETKVDARAVA